MTEPPRQDDTGVGAEDGESTGLARWQKVLGLIGLVVLLVVIGLVIGGGHTPPVQHGP
ncbi:MAG: hypothetical protein ACRDWA_10865 [Acidimicrobiia bacterium]